MKLVFGKRVVFCCTIDVLDVECPAKTPETASDMFQFNRECASKGMNIPTFPISWIASWRLQTWATLIGEYKSADTPFQWKAFTFKSLKPVDVSNPAPANVWKNTSWTFDPFWSWPFLYKNRCSIDRSSFIPQIDWSSKKECFMSWGTWNQCSSFCCISEAGQDYFKQSTTRLVDPAAFQTNVGDPVLSKHM